MASVADTLIAALVDAGVHRIGYLAIETCDLLLMLGTDFPYDNFYPHHAKIVQIDIRPENLGRRSRLDFGLVGDIRETLDALLPKLKPNANGSHLEHALRHYSETTKKMLAKAEAAGNKKPIHPE
ncbi:MAG: hypothetical protein WB660_28715 [Candidatus Sulfotelmatobacter sp.]